MSISIQLPTEVEQRIESLSAQTGISREALLLRAIESGIGEVEGYYATHETLAQIRKRTLRDVFVILAYREYSEDFFAASWLAGISEQSLAGRFERFIVEMFTNPLETWEEQDLPVLRAVSDRILDLLAAGKEGP